MNIRKFLGLRPLSPYEAMSPAQRFRTLIEARMELSQLDYKRKHTTREIETRWYELHDTIDAILYINERKNKLVYWGVIAINIGSALSDSATAYAAQTTAQTIGFVAIAVGQIGLAIFLYVCMKRKSHF